MRNAISILSALFFLFVLAGIVSCTKKRQPDTQFTRVSGRWKKVQYATDDNNNGKIDEQEIRTQPVNFVDILQFNSSDTTGFEAVNHDTFADTARFTWYAGSDSLYIAYDAHLSLHYYIEHVSSANLTIITTTSTGLAWYNYASE